MLDLSQHVHKSGNEGRHRHRRSCETNTHLVMQSWFHENLALAVCDDDEAGGRFSVLDNGRVGGKGHVTHKHVHLHQKVVLLMVEEHQDGHVVQHLRTTVLGL